MEKKKEDTIISESFLQRLKYNSQTYHVVLYSSPKGFEYNIDTKMIRPLDSILWYDVRKEKHAIPFIEFLSSYCESQARKFDEDCTYSTNCMRYYNQHLSVDLDRLGKNLLLRRRTKENKELTDSFFEFKAYIDYLYQRNEKLIHTIVDMQRDLL